MCIKHGRSRWVASTPTACTMQSFQYLNHTCPVRAISKTRPPGASNRRSVVSLSCDPAKSNLNYPPDERPPLLCDPKRMTLGVVVTSGGARSTWVVSRAVVQFHPWSSFVRRVAVCCYYHSGRSTNDCSIIFLIKNVTPCVDRRGPYGKTCVSEKRSKRTPICDKDEDAAVIFLCGYTAFVTTCHNMSNMLQQSLGK